MVNILMLDFVSETSYKYILSLIHYFYLNVLVLTDKNQDTFLTQISNAK
jgi:hypothetical protein